MATTIVAVATPPGVGGVAVLRISGPQAGPALRALAGRYVPPRVATLCEFRTPTAGGSIDVGLALWFPAPRSFTGEEVAELHLHGGRAVVAAALAAVLEVDGIRLAEPGEFTRRAFESGKLDLTEVEGLGDLLWAETEAQRRQAVAQFTGRLSSAATALRDEIVGIAALVEASIDFPDEDDVAIDVLDQAKAQVRALLGRIDAMIADAARGERVRDGLAVVIAGPPNAGKSTLLNALARRDVAIVSPVPGTTRDSIEVHLDLGGAAVVLVDTAGLRASEDPVEVAGIDRTRRRLSAADLVLWLDPGLGLPAQKPELVGEVWSIRSQIDRAPSDGSDSRHAIPRHAISAHTGEGMDELLSDIQAFALSRAGGEPALLTRERHRQVIGEVRAALALALARSVWHSDAELVAEHLRQAIAALGGLTGHVGPEAVLDRLFSAFCIGK